MGTVIIGIILIVICIFAVKNYVKKLQNGCCGTGGNNLKKRKSADENASHYPYAYRVLIEGMTCRNCAIRIENAFHAYEGYYAQVDLKKSTATVHVKEAVDEFDLKQIVTRAGYTVKNVEVI